MFCREQAAQLRGELSKIRDAGAELIFVGNGAPHFARGFKDELGISSPLYTDPTLEAYKAAGLKYGAGNLLRSAKHVVRALSGGFLQGRTKGSAWQQGGVLVIDRDGALLYAYASQEGGDHPPAAEIHRALARAAR
jgi:peroxiredoxin